MSRNDDGGWDDLPPEPKWPARPTSLPRDRVGDGNATETQWAAARRWSARYSREHRHEDPWDRWNRGEQADEDERFRRS